ncbi:MAG: CHAT domain-containing protein [Promethearchaeota archaeon]
MQEELNKFQWVTAQLIRLSNDTPLEKPYKETYIPDKKIKKLGSSIEIFSEDPIFDSYCRKCVQLVRENIADKALIKHCIDSSRKCEPTTGRPYFYYLDLLRIVSKEFDDFDLQQDAAYIFIEYLKDFLEILKSNPEVYSNDEKMDIMRLAGYGHKILQENSEIFNIVTSVNYYLQFEGLFKVEGGIPEFIEVIKQLISNSTYKKLDVPWSETYSTEKYNSTYFQRDNQYEIFYKDAYDPVFDSYCQKVVQLIRNKTINIDLMRYCLHHYREMAGKSGDAMDYLLDLVRIVSKEFDNTIIQKSADEVFLEFLLEMYESLMFKSLNDESFLRKARKCAKRGLKVIEGAISYEINPKLIAEFYIAIGMTFTHFEPHLALAYYLQAHPYTKSLDRTKHDLPALIEKRIHEVTAMSEIGVLGNEIINALELGYKGAKLIERQDLVIQMGRALCNQYSKMKQPSKSEALARELLKIRDLNIEDRDSLRFALASSLSEQFRGEEAIEIQEALLNENSPILLKDGGKVKVTLYMNLGNSFRVANRLEDALNAFTTAKTLNKELTDDFARTEMNLRLHTLTAQILISLNEKEKAIQELNNLDLKDINLYGMDRLNFNELLAQLYYKIGQYDKALTFIENARLNLNNVLERGVRPDVWESTLNAMHDVDGLSIELNLDVDVEKAFLISESSKGRILRMLASATEWSRKEDIASKAISLDVIEESFRNVEKWISENPKSVLISFFAIDRGLIFFAVSETGKLEGKIIRESNYTDLLDNLYVPWIEMIEGWNRKDIEELKEINEKTEELLKKIGEFLLEAYPRLEEGGKNLVIIPHRLFRSIPLIHCKLPNNLELSECFERVIISPTLESFSISIEKRYKDSLKDKSRIALVDPKKNLPFARLEGYNIAGTANIRSGLNFTSEEVRKALANNKIVLMSTHGEFDNAKPWDSYIEVSPNSELKIYDILEYFINYHISTELVVLGACEAARTQRTISDEPIGFPGILACKGVKLILAPLWDVGSFSAFLFISKFFDYIQKEEHPNSAVQKTAMWLKNLNATDAKELLEKNIKELKEMILRDNIEEDLSYLFGKAYEWIDYLNTKFTPQELPFDYVVEWGVFQLIGYLNI